MERTYFEHSKGQKVYCVFLEPDSPSRKLVMLLHGFRSSSDSPSLRQLSEKLIEAGYAVLRFDQPKSGKSSGKFVDSSFSEWVETTKHFLRKYLKQGYRIALFGNSMGATAAVIAVGNDEFRNIIPCVVLRSPDPKSTVAIDPKRVFTEEGKKYYGKFWTEVRDAELFRCLEQYSGAIHLVYGENDVVVEPKLQKKVMHTVRQKNQTVFIASGQGHSHWSSEALANVMKREVTFLKEYL